MKEHAPFRGVTRPKGWRHRLVASLAMAGAMAVVPTMAGASTSSSHAVKPDYAYFRGQTITYVLPQPPGNSFWPSIVAAQPYVQNYLHATLNLVSIPAGSSVVGQETINSAAPNGLTIGSVSDVTDTASILQNVPFINFDFRKLSFIAGEHGAGAGMVTACANSPYQSFDQLLHATTTVRVISSPTGPSTLLAAVLMHAYGVNVRYITGYPNTAAQVAACLAGSGDIMFQGPTNFTVPEISPGGPLKPILLAGSGPVKGSIFYDALKNVPVWSLKKWPAPTKGGAAALNYVIPLVDGPNGLGVVIAAPPGTPAKYVLALHNAFKFALTKIEVLNAERRNNLPPGYVDPTTIRPLVSKILAHSSLIGRYLTLTQ